MDRQYLSDLPYPQPRLLGAHGLCGRRALDNDVVPVYRVLSPQKPVVVPGGFDRNMGGIRANGGLVPIAVYRRVGASGHQTGGLRLGS